MPTPRRRGQRHQRQQQRRRRRSQQQTGAFASRRSVQDADASVHLLQAQRAARLQERAAAESVHVAVHGHRVQSASDRLVSLEADRGGADHSQVENARLHALLLQRDHIRDRSATLRSAQKQSPLHTKLLRQAKTHRGRISSFTVTKLSLSYSNYSADIFGK